MILSGRRWQYNLAKAFRGPTVGIFKLVPRPIAKWLFGLFRWSDSMFGFGIRYLCIHRLAKSCGDKVVIGPGNFIYFPERLELGTNVYINPFCHIQAAGGIKIGDGALIAHQCTLMSGDHRFDIPGKMIFECETLNSPITLEDDVWLGAAVRVMRGVTIGTGSIVGAGAIVTKDIPAGQIAVGMPAKVIRPRFPEESPQQALDQADASRSQSSNTINA
jgi:acetyltransferase-like isoleucine patch superfamily enzyme